jgi:hypothetical protein
MNMTTKPQGQQVANAGGDNQNEVVQPGQPTKGRVTPTGDPNAVITPDPKGAPATPVPANPPAGDGAQPQPPVPAQPNETARHMSAAHQQPQPQTTEQYLATLPPELREHVESGLRLHAEKKAGLIANIKGTGRCIFTDQQLGEMKIEQLEGLAALAQVPTYDGVARPTINAKPAVKPEDDPNSVPVFNADYLLGDTKPATDKPATH